MENKLISQDALDGDSKPCAQILQSMNTHHNEGQDEMLMVHRAKVWRLLHGVFFCENLTVMEGFGGCENFRRVFYKEERKPSFLFEDAIDLMEAIVLLTQIKKEFMTRIL